MLNDALKSLVASMENERFTLFNVKKFPGLDYQALKDDICDVLFEKKIDFVNFQFIGKV